MKRTGGNRLIDRNDYPHLPRYPLVICASLVQNPANLGGLCRSCEAFRVEAMVLADSALLQTAAFRNLAASTHHWQPLVACTLDRLPTWLIEQRQAGYSLIALHADSTAVSLSQFGFPRRSVLVLGQELTGIPAEILALCEHTITIPQFGLVDSLNVQTAGAIAVYEYVRQHQLG